MYVCGILAVFEIFYVVESRVYCQDSNATPWVPLGFTCPVVCANIVNAIERIKILDFKEIVYRTPKKKSIGSYKNTPLTNKQKISNAIHSSETADYRDRSSDENFIHRKANDVADYKNKDDTTNYKKDTTDDAKDTFDSTKDTIDDAKDTSDTFDEIQFHKDVIKLSQRAAKTFKGNCDVKIDGMLDRLKKCARRSNYDGSFLNIMTNMLNKYVKSKYQFTEEMTEVLLEKLLGKNTDLRNSIFDVNKLLKHLRQAIHRHRDHENQDVISLRSQHCTTISLPGCFCRSGFVEDSGQCVKPSDCVDAQNAAYLTRIKVL